MMITVFLTDVSSLCLVPHFLWEKNEALKFLVASKSLSAATVNLYGLQSEQSHCLFNVLDTLENDKLSMKFSTLARLSVYLLQAPAL